MSFLSVLKAIPLDVGKALLGAAGVGQQLAPAVEAVNPGVGAGLALVSGLVIMFEQLIPGIGKGAVRKPIVAQVVAANAPAADQAVVAKQIDDFVVTMNTLQKLAAESPAAFQELLSALGAK